MIIFNGVRAIFLNEVTRAPSPIKLRAVHTAPTLQRPPVKRKSINYRGVLKRAIDPISLFQSFID